MLVNHDPNLLLARTRSGTLRLIEDSTGLKIDADMPDTQLARDVRVLLQRGDFDQMSFAFFTVRDEWSTGAGGIPIRTLHDLEIDDVSIVTFPAYPATSVKARGLSSATARRIIAFWDLAKV